MLPPIPRAAIKVKTTAANKARVEALAPAVEWSPILGNAAYLRWLAEECASADKLPGPPDPQERVGRRRAAETSRLRKHLGAKRKGL